jgi:hypothetical protein
MDCLINKTVTFCRNLLFERTSQICSNHSDSELYKNLQVHKRDCTRSCWVHFPKPVKFSLPLYFFFLRSIFSITSHVHTGHQARKKNIIDTLNFIFPMPSFVHNCYMSYFWNTRRKSYIVKQFSPVNC